MDIHQLRSWIFELYEPLENERQYIVYDAERGNLLVDVPPFSDRALRLIRGTGPASVLIVTNAARGADAARYREALGVQIAAHAADAGGVPDGPDLTLRDDELVRPDARAVRIGADGAGATVVLVRKAGGVLCCGDLDLTSDAARSLMRLEFSSVLSARRPPMWNAGRDTVLVLQRELHRPTKRFGILLQAPWDRAYKGRLEDQMTPSPLVPRDTTAAREAGMGRDTLVVARQAREQTERAPRPVRAPTPVASAAGAAPAAKATARPRSFAEDWQARGTAAPPTTVPNRERDIQPVASAYRPVSLGRPVERLAVETLAGLPSVDFFWGGIDLSPDGREVAFSWNRSGSFELYSAPLDGERIFQLTDAGGARSVWPRWSNDGQRIAFLRDTEGSERLAIWLVDRDGEHERKLSRDDEATHREIEWLPDGSAIACAANVGGRSFGVQIIDAATGERRSLTDGAHDDANPRVSPDGRWIVFESRRSTVRTDADLFLVPAGGGEAIRLETRAGRPGESLDARWSPDGGQLSFTTNARGRQEIALADLDGTAVRGIRYLTENPFDESEAVWRPDGRAVVYLHNRDASLAVHRVFTASHAATPVADLPGTYRSARVGPDDTVVATFSTPRRPNDVWVREAEGVALRPLTNSLGGRLDPALLVDPSHVRYPSADGREIPALLFVPHSESIDGGPPGAVLYIHGGPTGQHFRWWDPQPQLLANRGLVVLAPNVRGSTGYGREFQEANRRDWGGGDLADVIAGIDWLVAQGIADRERIGITGGSYGGFMTLLALGRHPDRFAAGVSIVGVVSLRTLFETTRGDLREYLLRELGDPGTESGLYDERSPLTYADRIRAPLLVLQGANDPRVPKAEALQIVEALERAKTPHAYHEYADEGHGFAKTANRIDATRRTVDWLDRYLTPLMRRYLA